MNLVVVGAHAPGTVIDPNIYGHFSEHLGRCVYEGYWVGEGSPIPNVRGIRSDVVGALRALQPPVLRWPGGCFADEYHWRDGIGPREQRPAMVNTHWGRVVENNHFGTHEFFDLCELLGAAPYICGNVGSGSVREMQQWVEYITFEGSSPVADQRRANGRAAPWKLPYFGIGNENWGCGGNMRPEYYADVYRRHATYVRHLGGNRVFKIACGAGGADYHWTDVLMREAGRQMDGLSLHYYTHVGRGPGLSDSATDFGEAEWFSVLRSALRIEDLVRRHAAVMDRHDPERRVAMVVDEWGAWYRVEPGTNPGFLYQQNTLRDALVAGVHLNVFNNHAGRVRMANIAQTVNVLQAMILTRGPEMLCTPTYHVFEMYKGHQGATLLPTTVGCERYVHGDDSIAALSASASRGADGRVRISLCNLHPESEMAVDVRLPGMTPRTVAGRVLTAPALPAHNTFEAPAAVAPAALEGARVRGEALDVVLPPRSVTVLEVGQ